MNKIKNILKKITRPTFVSILLLFAMIIFIVSTSWILYTHTVNILTENLKERFLTTSIIQATNIDSDNLNQLKVESDWQKPEWSKVVNKLHAAKYSSKDIVFMYIFRKTKADPIKMEFVADADSINPYANTSGDPSKQVDVNRDGKIEPDGPDKLQWPGQSFEAIESVPEAYEAYSGPINVKDIYTDQYGSVLTSFAPIKDKEGNVVAILGTDIKADDFFTTTKQTLQPFLIFIASLSLIISILVIIIILSSRKYSRVLEIINNQQEALIHFVTHQVKGFLTKSKFIFSLMMEGDYGPISEVQRKIVEDGYNSDLKGIMMVQDILHAANLKNGTVDMNKQDFDFRILVTEVINELGEVAVEKGLVIESHFTEGSYTISGDALQLKQAIKNLVDNSIKYTPAGNIKISLTKNPSGKINLKIEDTGVGINLEDKKRLFSEGGKGKDSIKVNVESTGYGLFIVKKIIEANKGRVWAESEGQGKGSQFYVELEEKK